MYAWQLPTASYSCYAARVGRTAVLQTASKAFLVRSASLAIFCENSLGSLVIMLNRRRDFSLLFSQQRNQRTRLVNRNGRFHRYKSKSAARQERLNGSNVDFSLQKSYTSI
ncbi:MAG: hypothetical protein RR540_01630 [Oscillospiraceae bacterium]